MLKEKSVLKTEMNQEIRTKLRGASDFFVLTTSINAYDRSNSARTISREVSIQVSSHPEFLK